MTSVQVVSAATNVARDGHYALDATSGLYTRTLLVEAARTNVWYADAEDFSAWSTDATVTVSANAAVAPDGAATADRIVEASGATSHHVYKALSGLADSTTQAVSVFARAGERTWLRITTRDKANVSRSSWVDLANAAAGTVGSGHTLRVVACVNGWVRAELTFSSASGATTPVVFFALARNDGDGTYSGDTASGLYLWGAQFETDQPFPSSYIAPTVASGARAADAVSFPFPYTPQAMTILVSGVELGGAGVNDARLLHVGAAGDGAPQLVLHSTGSVYRGYHHNGTTSVNAPASVAPSRGAMVDLRLVLFADGSVQLGQSIDGGTEAVSSRSAALALATAWSGTTLWVGSVGGANGSYFGYARLVVARGERTLAEMQSL